LICIGGEGGVSNTVQFPLLDITFLFVCLFEKLFKFSLNYCNNKTYIIYRLHIKLHCIFFHNFFFSIFLTIIFRPKQAPHMKKNNNNNICSGHYYFFLIFAVCHSLSKKHSRDTFSYCTMAKNKRQKFVKIRCSQHLHCRFSVDTVFFIIETIMRHTPKVGRAG